MLALLNGSGDVSDPKTKTRYFHGPRGGLKAERGILEGLVGGDRAMDAGKMINLRRC